MKKGIACSLVLLAAVVVASQTGTPAAATALADRPRSEIQAVAGGQRIPAQDQLVYLPFISRERGPIFLDQFNDPNSGWPVGSADGITWSYQNGEYQIRIAEEYVWAGARPTVGGFDAYALEAAIRRHSGTGGYYGLIFGMKDWDHFYVFMVQPDSQVFSTFRFDSPSWSKVVDWTSSSSIKAGAATNVLMVRRVGTLMTLFANDDELIAANDGNHTGQSDLGLFALTGEDGHLDIRYDYVAVWDATAARSSLPAERAPTRPAGFAELAAQRPFPAITP